VVEATGKDIGVHIPAIFIGSYRSENLAGNQIALSPRTIRANSVEHHDSQIGPTAVGKVD
jgi:hypothetical protein